MINAMLPSYQNLLERLRAYDGRAITLLGEIEADFGREADYLDVLIALAACEQAVVSDGATWLIKSAMERGRVLSIGQADDICGQIPNIAVWQAQLHICQSFSYLKVSGRQAGALAHWLTPLLSHERPFLRAWSADALCRLGAQHEEYAKVAAKAVKKASNDPAASVRARARNLAKELGY